MVEIYATGENFVKRDIKSGRFLKVIYFIVSPSCESIEGPFIKSRPAVVGADREKCRKTEKKDDPWFIVLSMCTVSISMANLVS